MSKNHSHIRYAFRIIHIDNIPNVLKYGIVHKNSSFASVNYVSIGDTSVMDARQTKQLPNGKMLSDYIPFYFGPRSPMLYNIQYGNGLLIKQLPEDIVYCVVRIEDVIKSTLNCVFSDGHALDGMTSFYDKMDLQRLDEIVHKEDIYATYWFNQNPWDDRKRKKEAELLFLDDVPLELIKGFIVYNQNALDKMLAFGLSKDQIVVEPKYYY